MLPRMSANLLIVLTLSPFTAPFSTCDLATWLGGTTPGPARTTHSRSLTTMAGDASISQVRPLVRSAGRTRLVALSGRGSVSAVRELPAGVVVPTLSSAVSAALVPRAVLRI
jgi:hypothetical protein